LPFFPKETLGKKLDLLNRALHIFLRMFDGQINHIVIIVLTHVAHVLNLALGQPIHFEFPAKKLDEERCRRDGAYCILSDFT
jgi:hypothetical protein